MGHRRTLHSFLVGVTLSLPLTAAAQDLWIESSPSNDALFKLAREGIHRRLEAQEMRELDGMLEFATTHARSLNLGCRRTGTYEVSLKKRFLGGRVRKVKAGYQVAYWCDEAPSPALGLYFDLRQKYLGSVDRD